MFIIRNLLHLKDLKILSVPKSKTIHKMFKTTEKQ